MNDRYNGGALGMGLDQQAMMQRQYQAERAQMGQIQGQTQVRVEKDPSVASLGDAVTALKKRAAQLQTKLDEMESLQSELRDIERMLATLVVGP